jgi:glycosyltransferase involved in cell wall biosynthesis
MTVGVLDNYVSPATIATRIMVTPKVSIVTPSFNQARYLPQTLQCIREQDYPDIEHIVVDGGSTDGTLEILRDAPGIRWSSERDHGQVDALNKGFKMCTGDILAWLNSDDTMNRNTVSAAVGALQRTGADLVYGDVDIVDEHGELQGVSRGIPFDFRVLLCGIDYIGQQTVFFRRELLERSGPLREELDNGFDYELWLRMAQHGELAYAPEIRAQIRVHPAAKSITRVDVSRANRKRIRAEYWKQTGLPAILRTPPLSWGTKSYYRVKRKWLVRSQKGRCVG